MSEEDRRRNDEAFKLKLIEQQGEIKALLSSSNAKIEELAKELSLHAMSLSEIRWALWGGPKESDVGLLEKHRRLQRNWTFVVSVFAFIFSAFGKSAEPLISKYVSDRVYNSASQKWMREQKRPRVRVYKIYRKAEPKEDEDVVTGP